MRPDIPHVPLEAGLGPDNPPCPACGEPLFPWVGLPVSSGVAHRCESCGLGTLATIPNQAEAMADLDADAIGKGWYAYDNRRSWQASLTGGAWYGLSSSRDCCFTPEAVRDLVANRDQVVTRNRWMPVRSIATMWQSGINMFTFGQNIALAAFGKARPTRAREPWQRGLDAFISVALAIPAMVVAIPLELIAGLFRRGGRYKVQFQVL